MKKFVKVCAILALVFVLIGAGLFYLGSRSVSSSSVKDIVDELTNGKVSFDLGFSDWDLSWFEGNAIYNIDEAQDFNLDYSIYSGNMAKSFSEVEEVKNIKLAVGGYSVTFEESRDGYIYVEAKNVGKMQAYLENDTLYVKALHEEVNDISNSYITVSVPSNKEFDSLHIDLGAGELNFENLICKEVELTVGAGRIQGEGLKCETVNANVGAGEICLYDVVTDSAVLVTNMGNCEFGRSVAKELEAVCTMGNISLYLDEEMEDYNIGYACTFGTVEIDGQEYTEGERNINNGASKNLDLVCTMGNIDVNF